MKVRNGFVSNSSSTAFIITNLTDEEKTIADFARETPRLIEEFKEEYDWYKEDETCTQENLVQSAEAENIVFAPHSSQVCIFGDEQGTLVGKVYDYMLRGKDMRESAKIMRECQEKCGDKFDIPDEMCDRFRAAILKEQLEDKDDYSGINSPSFKVRFHEWHR